MNPASELILWFLAVIATCALHDFRKRKDGTGEWDFSFDYRWCYNATVVLGRMIATLAVLGIGVAVRYGLGGTGF